MDRKKFTIPPPLHEETYKEEKTFPAGKFRRGELVPEGEIVLIVITIFTGIIEIIITNITNTSTISTFIPSTSPLKSELYLALFIPSTLPVLITPLWRMLLSFVGRSLL